MGILEKGGNAFDAAVAACLTSHVVDPHMNGFGGELVAIVKPGNAAVPTVICGQGTAPERATINAYRDRGFQLIPDTGVMSAVVPGTFGALMLMLRDFGTFEMETVMEAAVAYAGGGFPVSWEAAKFIGDSAELFRTRWTSSAAIYLPGNQVPKPGSVLTNRPLGDTLSQLTKDAKCAGSTREARIDAAQRSFYSGFVAERLGRFTATYHEHDRGTGRSDRSFLTADDLERWRPQIEPAASIPYEAWQVFKPGPWAQGPVLLQTLSILKNCGIGTSEPLSPEFIHVFAEATKLAFSDREAWYGDPDFVDVPLTYLLSDAYGQERSRLITSQGSQELRPGAPAARSPRLPVYSVGESPRKLDTAAKPRERDTCHINVIDKWRNVVAVTPSGGWIQGSPVVDGLGFALSTRAQMFWLQEGLASSLAPRKRPRTTLSPTLAVSSDDRILALGCRGADNSDQWLTQFLIHFVNFKTGLQQGVDTPVFASEHWPNSTYPRNALPGRLTIDRSLESSVGAQLAAKGHEVRFAPEHKLGRTCAALLTKDVFRAAVTGRLPQAAAVGR